MGPNSAQLFLLGLLLHCLDRATHRARPRSPLQLQGGFAAFGLGLVLVLTPANTWITGSRCRTPDDGTRKSGRPKDPNFHCHWPIAPRKAFPPKFNLASETVLNSHPRGQVRNHIRQEWRFSTTSNPRDTLSGPNQILPNAGPSFAFCSTSEKEEVNIT